MNDPDLPAEVDASTASGSGAPGPLAGGRGADDLDAVGPDAADAALRRRGRRMLLALAGIAVLAALGMLLGRILQPPVRGDVTIDQVSAYPSGEGEWEVQAFWSAPAPQGCVVPLWKVDHSDRGWEVFSSAVAPATASFDASCITGNARAVLETVRTDPTGITVVVNGRSFVVDLAAHGGGVGTP